MTVTLSARMQANAALLSDCRCLADVGCDHAYLSIEMVHCQKANQAIAMDVRSGPLDRARAHIIEAEKSGYIPVNSIQTRLSDGLTACQPGEVDAVLIAGMGGMLTLKILREGRNVCQKASQIVLQPQSDLGEVRKELLSNGYDIQAEDMVFEDGKYYPMMKVRYRSLDSEEKSDDWSDAELRYGRLLLQKRHPVLHQYLLKRQGVLKDILAQIPAEHASRRDSILQEADEINTILEKWT